MKIDGHAHVFLKSLPMLETRRYTPDYDATFEEYFQLLKSQKLDGALLVQPSFLGTDNSYLLNALDKARQQEPALLIKGVAVVEPSISMEEMSSLKQSGITGIRLNCISRPLPEFKDNTVKSFFKRVDSFGWHVEIQVEGDRLNTAIDKLLSTNRRIVIDHFGLPSTANEHLDSCLRKLVNTKDLEACVKISAPYRVFPKLSINESVKQCSHLTSKLLDTLGHQRLIWGSDWPWTQNEKGQSYQDSIHWAQEWMPNQDYEVGKVPNWLLSLD